MLTHRLPCRLGPSALANTSAAGQYITDSDNAAGSGTASQFLNTAHQEQRADAQSFNWVLAYKTSEPVMEGSVQGMDEDTVKEAFGSCNKHCTYSLTRVHKSCR